MRDVDPAEARRGVEALLGIVLSLLGGFIGDQLTTRLVQEVWPDLPTVEPSHAPGSDGHEADS
jgi:hypothetical protein